MDPLVAEALRAGRHHLEVVVAGQVRAAAAAGDAHLGLGLLVVRQDVLVRQRPVDEIGAGHLAVRASGPKFVGLEARTVAGPVYGGAAHGLAGPERRRPMLGDVPRLAHRIEPTDEAEHVEIIVLEVGDRVALAGLDDDDVDAFGSELVRQRSAAGARTDDDDDIAVVEIEFRHGFLPRPILSAARRCRRSRDRDSRRTRPRNPGSRTAARPADWNRASTPWCCAPPRRGAIPRPP